MRHLTEREGSTPTIGGRDESMRPCERRERWRLLCFRPDDDAARRFGSGHRTAPDGHPQRRPLGKRCRRRPRFFPRKSSALETTLEHCEMVEPVSNVFRAHLPASKVFRPRFQALRRRTAAHCRRGALTALLSLVASRRHHGRNGLCGSPSPCGTQKLPPCSWLSSLQLLHVATINNLCYYRPKHERHRRLIFPASRSRRNAAVAHRRSVAGHRRAAVKTCPRHSAIPVHTADWWWWSPPSPH